MNGQFSPAPPSPGVATQRLRQWPGDADSALLRLVAALALSCGLHAAVFFLPYLGRSTAEVRSAVGGSQKPPPTINAVLAPAGEHPYLAQELAARMPPVPDAPAADRPAQAAQTATQLRAEGVGLLPLPAPEYYTTDQLSKRPQPLASAVLDAPEINRIVASGTMVLKLWINEFGVVADVEVEKTDLPELFSRTAIAAFKSLRFAPGERDGRPVGTVMRIEVSYDDGRARGL